MRRLRNLSAAKIRTAVYTLVALPLALNIAYDISKEGASGHAAMLGAGGILLFVLAMEIYLVIRRTTSKTLFSKTQLALYSTLVSQGAGVSDLIAGSMEVDILCDTLKSFTDDEDRTKALNRAIDEGKTVRVLVLDPDADCIQHLCDARSARRRSDIQCHELRMEIRNSIKRIEQIFGTAKCSAVIRKYGHFPTCSIYRFDEAYMVCTYTFGRGGSSPAMFLRMNDNNREFCRGLRQGFDEVWLASTTKAF